ncbi:MAG: hypothetical protein PHI83_07645 [Sphaerochaetaceae bacterium]|jgi:hypothetical protein|nr:hypothetical protein [Sphaerochaetaceae bacterium]
MRTNKKAALIISIVLACIAVALIVAGSLQLARTQYYYQYQRGFFQYSMRLGSHFGHSGSIAYLIAGFASLVMALGLGLYAKLACILEKGSACDCKPKSQPVQPEAKVEEPSPIEQ